jgi:alginate O-acetyltransferase complex protein AlgJ
LATKTGKPALDLRATLGTLAESVASLRARAMSWSALDRKTRGDEEGRVPAARGRHALRNLVIEGRDGFLFHRDHEAIEQVTGALTYSPRELAQWVSTVETRKAWCDAHGIVSRFLIAPEKHVVYEDKLPNGIVVSEERPAAKLLAAATSYLSDHILYPLETLQAARRRHETHYVTDTHWNNFGAFVAYEELVASLARDIELVRLEESDLAWTSQRYVGDLGVRFDPERFETIESLGRKRAARSKLALQNAKYERGNVQVFRNERADLPRCVLFRDSFASYLLPFMLDSFSRLVAVSALSIPYDLLREERPDVVIVEIAERFLGTHWTGQKILMPDDLGAPTFAEFTGIDLEALGRI